MEIVENNVWGTRAGRGTFSNTYDKLRSGVAYAHAPTERYINEDGETVESEPFAQPIGQHTSISQGDMRSLDIENEYDAVITDPPYYDNIVYSEVANYFYVWQQLLLEDTYDCFRGEMTPRTESIVTNPFEGKTDEDFEAELEEAFTVIKRALTEDGVLAFTYHHSDSESWGELLESLCEAGFEVTASYPIAADVNKFITGEAVEFDIIIVARPSQDREPVSWRNLRRRIIKTTKETHMRLADSQELSEGDIGVIEMGRAFHEYSKHHGAVRSGDTIMTAKEVVQEIYGILQEASDVGELDVYLDLLAMSDPSYSDLNMLSKGTKADAESMRRMKLYRIEDGQLILGTWNDPQRIAYIRTRLSGDDPESVSPLGKAQFLRYQYEEGKALGEWLDRWSDTESLRDICEQLADATGDETFNRLVGSDKTFDEYQ
ncbi:hypothetical protein [Halosegnis marinus]|nr:hypothetical protein [Halosegnis sp. DT85]